MTAGTTPGVRGAAAAARLGVQRIRHDPSTVLLLCPVVTAGGAFIANILAARALEPSGRGELALLLQIGYLSSLGLLLGCDRSVVAVYSGHPVRTVARSFVRLLVAPSALFLTLATAAVAVPLPFFPSWRVGLVVALLFAVVNAFVRAVRSVAIAAGRHRQFLVYTLVSQALMLLALVALAVTGVDDSVTWMLAYLLIGMLTTSVLLARWVRVPIGTGDLIGSGDEFRAARREGLLLFPSALAHSGILRLDRLLLAGLASTAALGIYATVATMTELIAWPLLAYVDSRLGRWRAAHDAGTLYLGSLLLVVGVYCVLATVVMSVALRLLLVPMLGPAYEPALALVVPLAAAAAVFGISQVLVSLLIAVRRASLASAVEVVGFAVCVVAYVLLIARFGALGAAYGSLLGYFVCFAGAGLVLLRVRGRR